MSSSYAARRGLKDGCSKPRFPELDSMMLMDDEYRKLDDVYRLCVGVFIRSLTGAVVLKSSPAVSNNK